MAGLRLSKAARIPAIDVRPRPPSFDLHGVEPAPAPAAPPARLATPSPCPSANEISSSTSPGAPSPSPAHTSGDGIGSKSLPPSASLLERERGSRGGGDQDRQRQRAGRKRGPEDSPLRKHACPICARAFARREHLVRHERSHRKERPFPCPNCEARFSRRELVKRHCATYHPGLSHTKEPSTTTAAEHETAKADAPRTSGHIPAATGSETAETVGTAGTTSGEGLDPSLSSHAEGSDGEGWLGLQSADTLEPPSDILRLTTLANLEEILASAGFGGQGASVARMLQQQPGPDYESSTNPMSLKDSLNAWTLPPSATTMPKSSFWHASFELSGAKHDEITQEAKGMLFMARIDPDYKLPSPLSLERYATTFFSSFLNHVPCIHVPTWKAKAAHPSLLLAMAAIGAKCQHEPEVALALYRLGRASILNFLELSSFSPGERSNWVIQALFLTMSFGIYSGDFSLTHEALACQTLLAQIVRFAAEPQGCYGSFRESPDRSWLEWVEFETTNRLVYRTSTCEKVVDIDSSSTTLAVYAFLNSLNLIFDLPPALLNSELSTELPCSHAEWAAATPETWAQLHYYNLHRPASFSRALQSLISPAESTAVPCSVFGLHIMLHAIIQQAWHVRQECAVKCVPPRFDYIEEALDTWLTLWEKSSESSTFPQNSHEALVFDSINLFRVARVHIQTDFRPIASAVSSANADTICSFLVCSSKSVELSATSTKAALSASDVLRDPVRLGIALAGNGACGPLGLPFHLMLVECCLYLNRWLRTLEGIAEVRWSVQQRQVVRNIAETLAEVDIGSDNRQKPLDMQCIYACTTILKGSCVWGISTLWMTSLECYAESITVAHGGPRD